VITRFEHRDAEGDAGALFIERKTFVRPIPRHLATSVCFYRR